MLSIGQHVGRFTVALAADQAATAADLQRRYGDAIDITVGALKYPLSEASSTCPNIDEGVEVADLSVTLDNNTSILAAAPGHKRPPVVARLTNQGDQPIEFSTGGGSGVLRNLDGKVVGIPIGNRADVGLFVSLKPGESATIPVVVNTASCDPTLGYEVPPGDYQLVIQIPYTTSTIEGVVVSSPMPVTVTP